MAFELQAEGGFSPDFLEALSPSQLKSYYRDLIRHRATRQREQLHIQVSAAAVVADGGKLAKAQDSALSDAAGHTTVRGQPAASQGDRKPTLDEAAQVQRSIDETAHLWKR